MRPLRALVALAALAVATAVLVPVPAAAQTPAGTQGTELTLVSNLDETTDFTRDTDWDFDRGEFLICYGQSFTTGDHPHGYRLSSVEVAAGSIARDDVLVGITGDSSGRPNISSLSQKHMYEAQLTHSYSSGTLSRSLADGDVVLDGGTTYWVTACEGNHQSDKVRVGGTNSDAQSGESGWAIGDTFSWLLENEWSDLSATANPTRKTDGSMKLRIKGYELAAPVTITGGGDPGVGSVLVASLADDDSNNANQVWQWARSASLTGTFTDIAGATDGAGANTSAYTATAADAGHYLRATVTYDDGTNTGQSARGVTEAAVEGEVLVSNLDETTDLTRRTNQNPNLQERNRRCFGTAFVTGDHRDGYRLSALDVKLGRRGLENMYVGIWSDDNGSPSLGLNSEATGGQSAVFHRGFAPSSGVSVRSSSVAGSDVVLEPGTTYWVAACNYLGGDNNVDVGVTESDSQTGGQGWAISDTMVAGNVNRSISPTPILWSDLSTSSDSALQTSGSMQFRIKGGPASPVVTILGGDEAALGTALTAALADGSSNNTNQTWQWARSATPDGTFTDITSATDGTGANTSTYTPTEADVGHYLRATVTYDDGTNTGQSAHAVTGAAVEGAVLVSNLDETTDTTRRSNASRQDGGFACFAQPFTTGNHPQGYRLSSLELIASSIDAVRIGIFSDHGGTPRPSQSGATSSVGDRGDVFSTVIDYGGAGVDTLAAPSRRTLSLVSENAVLDSNETYWVVVCEVSDLDGVFAVGVTDSDAQSGSQGWAVSDSSLHTFDVSSSTWDNLSNVTNPSFKTSGSMQFSIKGYEQAAPVTITGGGDPGVGSVLVASLADDDSDNANQVWQWARSASPGGPFTDIAGAADGAGTNTSAYTATAADVGHYLRASVTYDDSSQTGQSARAVTEAAVTAATRGPEFAQGNEFTLVSNLDETTDLTRDASIEEINGDALSCWAQPFTAGSHPHGYRLSSLELAAGEVSDEHPLAHTFVYIGRPPVSPADDPTYLFDTSRMSVRKEVDGVYSAGSPLSINLADDAVVLAGGQDYWVYACASDDDLRVALTDSDNQTGGAGWQISDTTRALVTNWADPSDASNPAFKTSGVMQFRMKGSRLHPGISIVGGDDAVVGAVLTAALSDSDVNNANQVWQWARGLTPDGTFTDIARADDGAGSNTSIYTPTDDDVGYYLRATVAYDDGTTTGESASAVTAVTVASTAPATGGGAPGRVRIAGGPRPRELVELTATLSDPDGSVSDQTWMWSRLPVGTPPTQRPRLVSNTRVGQDEQPLLLGADPGSADTANDLAQAFTTGGATGGYVLTDVVLALSPISSSSTSPDPPAVTLRSTSATGTVLATLDHVGGAAGQIRFTASTPVRLGRNATYWVAAEGGGMEWTLTTSASEDPGSVPGWRIADVGQSRDADSTGNYSNLGLPLRMQVRGATAADAGSSSSSYTPTRDDMEAGHFLRATVFYTDATGTGQTAYADTAELVDDQVVLVSNQTESAGTDYSLSTTLDHRVATAFSTGSNPSGYLLKSVAMGLVMGPGAGVEVEIRNNDTNNPGSKVLATLRVTLDDDDDTFDEFTSARGVRLEPRTTYWVALKRTANSDDLDDDVSVVTAQTDAQDSAYGFRIGDDVKAHDGTAWRSPSLNELKFTLRGEAISLVSSVGGDDGDVVTATGEGAAFAQMFTTGDHRGGYSLSSVELGLSEEHFATAKVWLRTAELDTSEYFFVPGTRVAELSAPSGVDDDTATLERFTAHDVPLEPNQRYWIEVEQSNAGGRSLQLATSVDAGVDIGSDSGWSLGGLREKDGSSWRDISDRRGANLKIRLHGSTSNMGPGPYVSNRYQQPRAAVVKIGSQFQELANSFTTGSHDGGYMLTSVTLSIAADAGTSVLVEIWSNNPETGNPSAKLIGTSIPRGVTTDLDAPQEKVLNLWRPLRLARNTTYHVLVKRLPLGGKVSVGTTTSNNKDDFAHRGAGGLGWSITDTLRTSIAAFGSEAQFRPDSGGRSFRMSLNGTTDEFGGQSEGNPRVSVGLAQVGVGVRAFAINPMRHFSDVRWQWQRGPARDGPFSDIPAAQGGTREHYIPSSADQGMWLNAKVDYRTAFGPRLRAETTTPQPVLPAAAVSNAGYQWAYPAVFALSDHSTAQAFSTGDHPHGYLLHEVRLALSSKGAAPFSWAIHADDGGEPASQPVLPARTVHPAYLANDNYGFSQLTHPQGVPLEPGTTYWAVVTPDPDASATMWFSATTEAFAGLVPDREAYPMDPGGLAGWSIDYEALAAEDGNWEGYGDALELGGEAVIRMGVAATPRSARDTAGQVTIADADGDGDIEAGDELTATLADADTVIDGTASWQWSRATRPDGNFRLIPGARSAAYTPVGDDEGYFLRAAVEYDDRNGRDKFAQATLPVPVGVATTVLVKNTAQSATASASIANLHTAFTTGGNPAGYALDRIGIAWGAGTLTSGAVEIREHTSSSSAGAVVVALEGPDSLTANQVNWFRAPAGTTLDADTAYFLRIADAGNISMTDSDSEDPGADPGWAIANEGVSGTSLGEQTTSVPRVEVRGYALRGRPSPPTGLRTEPGYNAVRLRWQPPAHTGHSDIVGYQVRYKHPLGSFTAWADVDVDGDGDLAEERTITLSDLDQSIARYYRFQVRAVNEHGPGTPAEIEQRPQNASLLLSNVDQAGGPVLRTASGRAAYAQMFTTGDHPGGYTLHSVQVTVGIKPNSGLRVRLRATDAKGTDPLDGLPGATDLNFVPGAVLATLSGTAHTGTPLRQGFQTSPPHGVFLEPDRQYWIEVAETEGVADGVSLGTTTSDRGVDAAFEPGFTVGNNVWAHQSGSWKDYSGTLDANLKIQVYGAKADMEPGPYVSNRYQQTPFGARPTTQQLSQYATSFTTTRSPEAAGLSFALSSVVLNVAASAGTVPQVAIHADDNGKPAASPITDGTLTTPSGISSDLNLPARAVFAAGSGVSLSAATKYWVVLSRASGSGTISVGTTKSNDEDQLGQRLVSDHVLYRFSIGNSIREYLEGSGWTSTTPGRSFLMSVGGTSDYFGSDIGVEAGLGDLFADEHAGVDVGAAQVGIAVRARINHPGRRLHDMQWQWQRSRSRSGPFVDIPAADGGAGEYYTPTHDDLGMWLKAKVVYSNAFRSGATDEAVTVQPVLPAAVVSNAGEEYYQNLQMEPDRYPVAQAFLTGPNTGGYLLREVRLELTAEIGEDFDYTYAADQPVIWSVHADSGGEPAAEPLAPARLVRDREIGGDSLSVLPDEDRRLDQLTHPEGVSLEPNTKYWVVVVEFGGVEAVYHGTRSEWVGDLDLDGDALPTDRGSAAGWSLDYEALAQKDGRWITFAAGTELPREVVLRMAVVASPRSATDTAGTVTVADADGDGLPEVRETLTASLADRDTVTADSVRWQWSRSAWPDGNFFTIHGAVGATYTPTSGDMNYYLRATADYDDGDADGKYAHTTTTLPVGVATSSLVKNTSQTSSSGGSSTVNLHTAFTTGDNPAGYALDRVGIAFGNRPHITGAVEIREHTSSTSVGDVVVALEAPAALTANQTNWFSAPTGTFLAANTTYFLRLGANARDPSLTSSDSEDPGRAHGWSIADSRVYGASLSNLDFTEPAVPRIDIHGVALRGPPGPPRGVSAVGAFEAVRVSWQPPGSLGRGEVARYETRYKETSEDDSEYSDWATVDASPGASEPSNLPKERQVLVGDLTNGTGYTLQVRAWNEYGPGTPAEIAAEPAALATLVSNIDQAAGTAAVIKTGQYDKVATTFTTGRERFAVWSVEAGLSIASGATVGLDIWKFQSGSRPDATNPHNHLAGLYFPPSTDTDTSTLETFAVPGVVLEPQTTYWITLERRSNETGAVSIATANTHGEDTVTPATGWTIGNDHQSYDNSEDPADRWSHVLPADELKLRIRGLAAHTSPAFEQFREGLFERPLFEGTAARSVSEHAADGAVVGEAVQATDDDGDAVTHSVATADIPDGADDAAAFRRDFVLDTSTGQITVRAGNRIDYETRPTYVVEVHASDGEDASGATETTPSLDAVVVLTVSIDNVDEPGTVAVRTPAVVGAPLRASLSDVDGPTRSVRWKWSMSSTADGTFTDIANSNTDTYTPEPGDLGMHLKATATSYTDPQGSGKTARSHPVEVLDNSTPSFPPATERAVAENAADGTAVGGPVAALEPDMDALTYSVIASSGTPGDLAPFNRDFVLDTSTGQVTVREDATLDHETQPTYVVTVRVSDGDDASGNPETGTPSIDASTTLTVQVTDVDEAGTVAVTGNANVEDTLSATLHDDDGAVSTVLWQWSKSATENGTYSDITDADTATYSPTATDLDQWLKVTARYSDPFGHGKSADSEPLGPVVRHSTPTFSEGATATRRIAEDAADSSAVSGTVRASDSDGDEVQHWLAPTNDADGADQLAAFNRDFGFATSSGLIRLIPGVTLDYETRRSYKVKVNATDCDDASGNPEGQADFRDCEIDDSLVLTVEVTNVDEAGTVVASGTAAVGVTLHGEVTDPDGSVSVSGWQWSRATSATGPFADLAGEVGRDYLVVLADQGYWLRVTASYADGHGSGKSGFGTTARAVRNVRRTNIEPEFAKVTSPVSVSEHARAGSVVGNYRVTDGDGDRVHCSVADDSGAPGDDLAAFERDFEWDCRSGRLAVRDGAALNYETRTSYGVVLQASDRQNIIDQADTIVDAKAPLRIEVTNADDPGVVTIVGDAAVGLAIEATLADDDGVAGAVSWQWSSAASPSGPFSDIAGADQPLLIPAAAEEGRWLRATAFYADSQGAGKRASAVAAAVTLGVPPPPADRNLWVPVSFTRDREFAWYDVPYWSPDVTLAEGGDAVTVWVRLEAPQDRRPYTVPIAVAHHEGAAEDDYVIGPVAVSFQPGGMFASFTVAALDDDDDDDGEYLILSLEVPDGLLAGPLTSMRVDITDSPGDVPPTALGFDRAAATASEGATVEFTLTLDPPAEVTSDWFWGVPVRWEWTSTLDAAAGGTPGSVSGPSYMFRDEFVSPPGLDCLVSGLCETGELDRVEYRSVQVTVTCGSDPAAGADHQITVRITDARIVDWRHGADVPPGGWPLPLDDSSIHEVTVTCTDAFEPADLWVRMSVASSGPWYRPSESGGPATAVVALSDPADRELTIPIETVHHASLSAADYTGVPDTVTFAVGQQTATFEVWATDDSLDDDGEWLEIRLGALPAGVALAGGQTWHSAADAYWDRSRYAIEIVDDDDTPTAATSGVNSATASFIDTAQAVEPGGVVTVTVELYRLRPFGEERVQQRNVVPLVYSYGGATAADWGSGVRGADPLPTELVFEPGQQFHKFRVVAVGPHSPDSPKTITIAFGPLPQGVNVYVDYPNFDTVTITVTTADG